MPVMLPVACPKYTVESTAWQLNPNVSCNGSPEPVLPTRSCGATPSSIGTEPHTSCEQVVPEPTVRENVRLKLPCPEVIWSVNGRMVPQATPGATQIPK